MVQNLTFYRKWALIKIDVIIKLSEIYDTSSLDHASNTPPEKKTNSTFCEILGQANKLLEEMFSFYDSNAEELVRYYSSKIEAVYATSVSVNPLQE